MRVIQYILIKTAVITLVAVTVSYVMRKTAK